MRKLHAVKKSEFDLVSKAINIADHTYRDWIECFAVKVKRPRSKALYDYDVGGTDDVSISEAVRWFKERKRPENIKMYGSLPFGITVTSGILTFKDIK